LPTASRLALPQAGVLIIVGVHQKHTFISFACPKETNQRKGHFSKRIFEHRSKPLQKQCVAAQLKFIVFLLILVEKNVTSFEFVIISNWPHNNSVKKIKRMPFTILTGNSE
jgi:hypothetical protein